MIPLTPQQLTDALWLVLYRYLDAASLPATELDTGAASDAVAVVLATVLEAGRDPEP